MNTNTKDTYFPEQITLETHIFKPKEKWTKLMNFQSWHFTLSARNPHVDANTQVRLVKTFKFCSVESGHSFRESHHTSPSQTLILHTSILKISCFNAFLSVWQDSSSPHRQEPFRTAYWVETTTSLSFFNQPEGSSSLATRDSTH